ncbi:MAG: RrF2 family transcriptional regulator [Acidimicrobiia bacterium]
MKLHLNQGTEYAYQALQVLEQSDDTHVTGRTVAEKLDVSTDYVAKVLSPLTRAGWVSATTGPAGGYRLRADLTTLCVLDLIEVVEGRVDRSRCMHGDSRDPASEICALHDPWIRARDSLLSELEVTPLAKTSHSS